MNDLLTAVKARGSKQTEFAYGILTADAYVKTLQDCVGLSACYRLASKGHTSFTDLMNKAAQTLVYSNPEMVVEEKRLANESYGKGIKIDLPKNTLMSFRHVLTSSTKDRDGDVLHSDGASVDPNMLLLWQHVHTLPIGKMIQVVDQTKNQLVVVSAIVDMNELCHDSAVMIDNGMGRFSHGFKAVEFTETKADRNGRGGGFNVTQFEIMEESLVSVPANVDAQTEEVLLSLVEGGKLTSPMLKRVGKGIRSRRNVVVPGVTIHYREQAGTLKKELVCQSIADLKAASDAGLIGGQKDENESGDRGEEGEGTKDSTGTSKEADVKAADKVPAEDADDTKMSVPASVPGALTNSFEAIRDALTNKLNSYLASVGQGLSDGDYAWVVGTFDSFVVVQINRKDRTDYYKINWEATGVVPTLTGMPKEIEIETSTRLVEKTLEWSGAFAWIDSKPYANEHAARINDPDKYEKLRRQNDKFGDGIHVIFGVTAEGNTEVQAIRFDRGQFTAEEAKDWLEENDYKTIEFEASSGKDGELTDTKLGRVLSLSNEKRIREAKDHVDEVHGTGEMMMSHKAMLRIASGNLKEVLASLGEVEQAGEQEMSVKDAVALVITKATPEQRKQLASTLRAIEAVEQQNQQVEQYQALVR